ncbi:tyrosine-protein kinase YwqD [Peptoclostridium acidaminophilum DSM 3953]|uniref:non-specific protein-tyrosine kinase n=1 Tax=Peptoclostridium acidaminophilum DSM 3953 TaxID=1286171 RepID=W8THJ7_PEPAC|nr:CpsD/CapB family tyrosine-protein kinase [Peptoclostridium acidaminophilum]AHM57308.1 tyrosine-protein kinase YwqD [Peptoclostridium acidaminophilum DSM 3953]
MKELIVLNKPKSPVSEAYRGVRTNIQFSNVDKNIKTILVTSSKQGEGKTTTVSNIAITMADLGKKTVIIDCDLRRPRLHKAFGMTNIGGVTDILLNSDSYKGYLKRTGIENLEIITAGQIPSNPSEMLSSRSMARLIEQIRGDYDYVFIDASPVAAVTDAIILSAMADGALLVCHSGGVEVELAKSAKQSLEKAGANIIGVVLNKINIEKRGSYYAYYYNYYSDDASSEGKGKGAAVGKEQRKAACGND